MTLFNALSTELFKLRRTIAVLMAALSPMLIVLFMFVMGLNEPFTTLNRNGIAGEWTALAQTSFRFWVTLLLPLLITLEAALLAGLEHTGHQWKSLLARPIPYWHFYVTKLLVLLVLVAISNAVLVAGILLNGRLLPHFQPELHFGSPAPWQDISREGAQVFCLEAVLTLCTLGDTFSCL